jgi:hypothetical protein
VLGIPIARRGIRRYLAEHNGIEVLGEAANGISAVEQIWGTGDRTGRFGGTFSFFIFFLSSG